MKRWLIFAERLLSHLTRRDRRVMERLCVCDRRDELVSDFMGIFGADVEKWEEWTRELTAIKYDEGVSFWPSDAPLPPPEPEGLWEHLQEKKREDLSALEEEAVVDCILTLSLARARREYEELHESQ